MIKKKICMLGSFAVGKTSLVARYVHGIFSEKYLTTIGVKIDRKEVTVEDEPISVMLWDIHGEDEFQKVRASYLRGMSGYFLVVDPTRPDTLDVANGLAELAESAAGDCPRLLLLNKCDLKEEWAIDMQSVNELIDAGWHVRETSAKLDENVEESFTALVSMIIKADAKSA